MRPAWLTARPPVNNRRRLLMSLAALMAAGSAACASQAPQLASIQSRGYLLCGVEAHRCQELMSEGEVGIHLDRPMQDINGLFLLYLVEAQLPGNFE